MGACRLVDTVVVSCSLFLLLMNSSEYCLLPLDSWEQLMEFKRNRGLVILPKLYPIIHKCTLYRMRMLHVINNLSAFLMFEVLETAWHKLERGIQSRANNLDDIIMLHDNYLDEILSKALLTPAYETLNLQIQQVIQTVLRFCGLEDALIFDANTSMQRKRSSQAGVGINTSSWSVEDSVLENPVGTIEGVPSYVITRLDDAFEDFNNQLYTLMSMLNEQVCYFNYLCIERMLIYYFL